MRCPTLYKLVSQTAFMSQLVPALSFPFFLKSVSYLFFLFFNPPLFPDPLPQISFLSLGSRKVHPPSFLSLLPSLRSQRNGWLSGMHIFLFLFFPQDNPPPPHSLLCLLAVCQSVCQLVYLAGTKTKLKDSVSCRAVRLSFMSVCGWECTEGSEPQWE